MTSTPIWSASKPVTCQHPSYFFRARPSRPPKSFKSCEFLRQLLFKSATQSSTTDLQSLPDRWPQPKCTFRWLRPDGFNCASSCYRLIWRHAECAIYQPNRKSIGQLLAAVSFPLYFDFWHLHALTLSFLLSFAHSTTGEKNNNNSRKFARWRDTSNHFGHLLILFIGKESTILPTDFIFFSLFSIHSTFVPFFFNFSDFTRKQFEFFFKTLSIRILWHIHDQCDGR